MRVFEFAEFHNAEAPHLPQQHIIMLIFYYDKFADADAELSKSLQI